ncbi:MAG: DNA polymerase III subunit gamma/tau [Oceanococcaceae bacterium]
MAYLSLARKWRPTRFADLVGQDVVRTALENALGRGQLHQALLFTGTRGVGKTTIARILARCLNCEAHDTPVSEPCGQCSACTSIDEGRFPDLFEIDAASRTKVDDTRELLDNIPYAPVRGRVKVYLIDEVHMLSKSSFNALLKTLEEPPPHVQFLLATTDPHKLPVTVLSRCLQFHLARIPLPLMQQRLQSICESEGVTADADGIARIARAGDGSLRDALSLLDQAIAFGGGSVAGPAVAQMLGTIERVEILQLVEALARRDAPALRSICQQASDRGLDFSTLLAELARTWQALALAQVLPADADPELTPELRAQAAVFDPADVQVMYQIACHARRDLDWAPDPRSGVEMALLRMLAFLPEGSSAGSAGAAEGGGQAPERSAPAAAAPGAAPVSSVQPQSPARPPAPVHRPAAEPAAPPSSPQAAPVPSAPAEPVADAAGSSLEAQFRALPQVQAFDAEFGPGLAVRNVHARAPDGSAPH